MLLYDSREQRASFLLNLLLFLFNQERIGLLELSAYRNCTGSAFEYRPFGEFSCLLLPIFMEDLIARHVRRIDLLPGLPVKHDDIKARSLQIIIVQIHYDLRSASLFR